MLQSEVHICQLSSHKILVFNLHFLDSLTVAFKAACRQCISQHVGHGGSEDAKHKACQVSFHLTQSVWS